WHLTTSLLCASSVVSRSHGYKGTRVQGCKGTSINAARTRVPGACVSIVSSESHCSPGRCLQRSHIGGGTASEARRRAPGETGEQTTCRRIHGAASPRAVSVSHLLPARSHFCRDIATLMLASAASYVLLGQRATWCNATCKATDGECGQLLADATMT